MALARWQATIVDGAGNVQPGASIEVRRESAGGPLVSLFSDRDGAVPLGNPFAADADGFAAFHAPGGAYRITASKGAFARVWRYVGIGLSAETDGLAAGVGMLFAAGTADADPGSGQLRLNHATPASATAVYIDDVSPGGASVAAWLNNFDDGGSAANRGTLQLVNPAGSAMLLARVTGSVADGGGYRKVSIAPLVTAGSFAEGEQLFLSFAGRGVDGGDVAGPAASVSGNLPIFNGATGKVIQDSGRSLAALAQASITFIIDGGGAAITTGIKGELTIPFACAITEWTLLADQAGSIVVDIRKDSFANYGGASMAGGNASTSGSVFAGPGGSGADGTGDGAVNGGAGSAGGGGAGTNTVNGNAGAGGSDAAFDATHGCGGGGGGSRGVSQSAANTGGGGAGGLYGGGGGGGGGNGLGGAGAAAGIGGQGLIKITYTPARGRNYGFIIG